MMKCFPIVFVMEFLFMCGMCSGTGDLVMWSVLLMVIAGNIPSNLNENICKEVNNFSVMEREEGH